MVIIRWFEIVLATCCTSVNVHNSKCYPLLWPHVLFVVLVLTAAHAIFQPQKYKTSYGMWKCKLKLLLLTDTILQNTKQLQHMQFYFVVSDSRFLGHGDPTTHVVHAWWRTTSFSMHFQKTPESEFQWTVDRTQRPSQLACMISWPQSYEFLSVGTAKIFGVFSANQ
jgi:hypothetical protein